jgi:hypothetical protein
MLTLSPKTRRQTRVVGIVCAVYGIGMLVTQGYVVARQAHKNSPIVFHQQPMPPAHRVAKHTKTKAPSASGATPDPPAQVASTTAQPQQESPAPPPSPSGGAPATGSPTVASVPTTVVSAESIAPPVGPPVGGPVPYGRGFIPNGSPGVVQRARPDYRGAAVFGPRPPNYPNRQGNRPPPQMPRGGPQRGGGNHQVGPPARSKP